MLENPRVEPILAKQEQSKIERLGMQVEKQKLQFLNKEKKNKENDPN